jgi:hypothetical protein
MNKFKGNIKRETILTQVFPTKIKFSSYGKSLTKPVTYRSFKKENIGLLSGCDTTHETGGAVYSLLAALTTLLEVLNVSKYPPAAAI